MRNVSPYEASHMAKVAYTKSQWMKNRWDSYDDTTDTRVVVDYSPERNEVVLAFRGTFSLRNWVVNLSLWPTHGVHRGVDKAVDVHFEVIKQYLDTLDHPSIIIVGHSLGGALAVEFAHRLYQGGHRDLIVVTFGAVRAHTRKKAAELNATVGLYVLRVTSNNDIVPRILGLLYRHVQGAWLYFDRKGYWHLGVSNKFAWWDAIAGRIRNPFFDGLHDHNLDGYSRSAAIFPYFVNEVLDGCIVDES